MSQSEYFDAQEFSPSALVNDILTEDSAAQAFVEGYGHELRFCHSSGRWYRWNGQIWKPDETHAAFHWARQLARRLSEDFDNETRKRVGKRSFAGGVESFAQRDPAVAVTISNWDADPWLLGTPKGTVDLRTGKLQPSDPKDYITKSVLVAPDSTECVRWRQFLNEASGGDVGLVNFLQVWCGYALTGVTTEHALAFVHGLGMNGKSVFLNTTTRIFGDYAAVASMDTFVASTNDRHPTDLAMLRGARLVTASETEQNRAWSETRIKQMTGGDPISARFMRQDFFTYTPQFKITIVGNNKPVLRNVDDAARRRFLIVPFEHKPANPDKDLEAKLMAEAPGILSWMIQGCLEWQKNGLVKPEKILAATSEYFSDQDLFAHWLAEECTCEPGNAERSAASSALFKSWRDFAVGAGHPPGSRQSFADQMTRHGFKYYRGARTREFFGISLRTTIDFNNARSGN